MSDYEKSDRLIEAATAILTVAPGQRLNAVVLNKALFYLDLAALRDRGQTVTGNAYLALPNGPVVARYPQRLIAELTRRGLGRQTSEWNGARPVQLHSPVTQFRYLDAEALSLVSAVTSFFASTTSGQASDYSHENPGWLQARSEVLRTGRPVAIDLRIALQQIIEDDPWMDSPLTDDDELLAAADAADGAEW